jgi:GT2 family glycosyltransferase
VTVLENGRNLGYTGGNNVGLRYALARGARYVWLVNNDAIVEPTSLSCLVQAAEARGPLGLVSPEIRDDAGAVYWAGTVLDAEARQFVDVVAARDAGTSVPAGPLLLAGTGLLIKRHAIETIGLLEERYFAYVEDFDYSLRAIRAGFETGVIPDARIVHSRSRSLGAQSPLRHYLIRRNQYLFWRSHIGAQWSRRDVRRHIALLLGEAAEFQRQGRSEMAAASQDAAWDAVRGRYGDMDRKGRLPGPLRRTLAWHPYFWIRLLEGRYGEILRGLTMRKRSGR